MIADPAPADAQLPVAARDREYLQLRRDDLAAMQEAYRRHARGRSQWVAFGVGLGGLAAGVGLLSVVDPLGWPAVLKPVFLAGGWAVLLAAYGVVTLRNRAFRERYQLRCPACHVPLMEANARPEVVTRTDLAIASGKCPHCGEDVLAP